MNRGPAANGYSLIDMLAAMLILGLAMVGFGQAMFALARLQGATTRTLEASAEARDAQSALTRLFAAPSATPDRLIGDEAAVDLGCPSAPCRAVLVEEDGRSSLSIQQGSDRSDVHLFGTAPAQFRYVLDQGVSQTWPVPSRRLIALQIQGADGRVLAYHRLWRQQPLDCAFDPVSRRCPTSP